MNWYCFHQNNSGGYFYRNDDVGDYVFIEADHRSNAEHKFEMLDNGADRWCECCGERWYGSQKQDEPNIYGVPVSESVKMYGENAYAVLHYANGTVKKIYNTGE